MVARARPSALPSTSGCFSAKASSLAACSRSAVPLRAETGQATTSGSPASGRATARATACGACSRITCALVPLIPNEDTPARRGRPTSGHSRASASSSTPPEDQSTSSDGSPACSDAGSTPSASARTILITPPTPAAACACPMFDFNEPNHNGRSPERSRPYVASNARASIGSPSRVPVPWASTASTSEAPRPAADSAARITRSCEGPFGAVNPFDAPSWFTAEPRTTANTRCPWRSASDKRSTTSTPTPSDQPVPSAPAENDRHRPSADNPRCRLNSTNMPGLAMTVTPPVRARSQSPVRSAAAAWCSATSEEEQAVSTVTAGPSRPREYATRPEMTLVVLPVSTKPSAPSVPSESRGPYSIAVAPT